ncbi:MAG TPA: 2-dehydropantoate 2-reductase [Solirubrobacteraceae bacterium]|nr:2-dehydropantoate 2-reductase [Solirubrobacteraceae bacterium]
MTDGSVLVIGAGAIGGVIAGLMTGQVKRVAVIDANVEHVRRLREPGLILELDDGSRTVPLDAYASVSELTDSSEFGLITVKAVHLEQAVRGVVDAGLAETYVALGNGLVQDRVAALVGAERLIAGTVELGATNLGPGRVRRTTSNPFVIGELDGVRRPRLERLADLLGTVDAVRLTGNIHGQIWSKLLVNSTFSGLGVIGGVLYRDVAEHPAGRRAIAAVWSEGYRIGMDGGLELEEVLGVRPVDLASSAAADGEARTQRAIDTVIGFAGNTKASMLQDVERGAATEVDVINGAIVERARREGSEAPHNEAIVEFVHQFERGERRPSPDLFAQVLAAG